MLAEPLSPSLQKLRLDDGRPVEWAVSQGYVDYAAAEAFMEARVAEIAAGEAAEMVWLLEHPPLYTAGVSAKDEDLLDAGAGEITDLSASKSTPATPDGRDAISEIRSSKAHGDTPGTQTAAGSKEGR